MKEQNSDTSILIMRDKKIIGRIWSQHIGDNAKYIQLPYPHNESDVCKNSIQICGFDRISEVWACGPFDNKKDCVVSFDTYNTDYDKQQIKNYEQYVRKFFTNVIKDSKVKDFKIIQSTVIKDITKLKSFNDWRLHEL